MAENCSKTRISKDNIEKNTDKLHRTRKYDQATKIQLPIIKFTSHSFREKAYFKQKTIKNRDRFETQVAGARSQVPGFRGQGAGVRF